MHYRVIGRSAPADHPTGFLKTGHDRPMRAL
jgi:hypothetical protein